MLLPPICSLVKERTSRATGMTNAASTQTLGRAKDQRPRTSLDLSLRRWSDVWQLRGRARLTPPCLPCRPAEPGGKANKGKNAGARAHVVAKHALPWDRPRWGRTVQRPIEKGKKEGGRHVPAVQSCAPPGQAFALPSPKGNTPSPCPLPEGEGNKNDQDRLRFAALRRRFHQRRGNRHAGRAGVPAIAGLPVRGVLQHAARCGGRSARRGNSRAARHALSGPQRRDRPLPRTDDLYGVWFVRDAGRPHPRRARGGRSEVRSRKSDVRRTALSAPRSKLPAPCPPLRARHALQFGIDAGGVDQSRGDRRIPDGVLALPEEEPPGPSLDLRRRSGCACGARHGEAAWHPGSLRAAQPVLRIMPNTPDPRRFFAATKLLLMPSLMENAALVAIEAMFNGIPVLASARGGLPETIGGSPHPRPLPEEERTGRLTLTGASPGGRGGVRWRLFVRHPGAVHAGDTRRADSRGGRAVGRDDHPPLGRHGFLRSMQPRRA